jgi:hypothetical protein
MLGFESPNRGDDPRLLREAPLPPRFLAAGASDGPCGAVAQPCGGERRVPAAELAG